MGGASLAERLPELAELIGADAAAARFAVWGESTVVDEHTAEPVIGLSLFDELHRLAGLAAIWPVGNAGLIHVYGYLLSTASTPYGPKRDRWTGGGVARALGLPDGIFAPGHPGASTPLERITGAATPILNAPGSYEGTLLWIEERSSAVVATTVVVRNGVSHALLYSVNGLLVTAFPVASPTTDWVDGLLAAPVRLRYNAVVGAPQLPLIERRVRLRRGLDAD